MARLKDKLALVTGAAQGIGAAIAELFIAEGARVIVTDIQDTKGAFLSERLGDQAQYHRLDVRKEEDWESLHHYIEKEYEKIDILVNNAGITGFLETVGPFDAENITLETWEEVHKTNNNGTMLGCKYAIKLMKENGGSIINISSRSGIVGIPGAVAYAASKAAIRNHSKSVALYCAQKGYKIRSNSIHPAAIMTPMWDTMLGEGEARQRMIETVESGIPLGRFGNPQDVAFGALYLASDESRYVTGIELHIDGGILAGATATGE